MNWPEIATVTTGGGLALAGCGWGLWASHSRARAVRRALASPDDQARVEAVRLLSGSRVAPYAPQLLAMAEAGPSQPLGSALAHVVATHQWEPVEDRAMTDLRAWAAHWMEAQRHRHSRQPDHAALLAAVREALPLRRVTGLRIGTAGGGVVEVEVGSRPTEPTGSGRGTQEREEART